jgi:hypothetical protein
MLKKSTAILLITVAIVALTTGCKSQRSMIKSPIKEKGPDYLFSKLKENELKFNTFEARFNIDYNENRRFLDFKGQVRIVKDSAIWITFNQDLGIEIARLLITEDSVKFVDRFNKQYLITDYDFINSFLNTNLDFGILQSIMLGNDFEYYEMAKFKASIDGGQYRLTTGGRSKLKKHVRTARDAERVFLQNTWLEPETFKILKIRLKELTRQSKRLTAEYSDFQNIEEQLFPSLINYVIEAEDQINVKVKFNRINLNKKLNFPFKIPESYSSAN